MTQETTAPKTNGLVATQNTRPCLNRMKGLKKLGVSEEDVNLAQKLLEQIPTCPSDPNKAERVLGYASSRLARQKALRLLGASEEEVELEYSKILGSLGIAGRRRSFSMMTDARRLDVHAVVFNSAPGKNRPSFTLIGQRSAVGGRRHTISEKKEAELKALRSKARTSSAEIAELKRRITLLESQLPAHVKEKVSDLGKTEEDEKSEMDESETSEELQ